MSECFVRAARGSARRGGWRAARGQPLGSACVGLAVSGGEGTHTTTIVWAASPTVKPAEGRPARRAEALLQPLASYARRVSLRGRGGDLRVNTSMSIHASLACFSSVKEALTGVLRSACATGEIPAKTFLTPPSSRGPRQSLRDLTRPAPGSLPVDQPPRRAKRWPPPAPRAPCWTRTAT